MIAPNSSTSLLSFLSNRTRRIALLVVLVAITGTVLSSTNSFAGSLREKLFTAISNGGQTEPELKATATNHALAHESEEAAADSTMLVERRGHTATRLPDGRVLIAGGENSGGTLNQTELYDPASGTFSAAANMSSARTDHTATLLADGRVLVAGGGSGAGSLATTEIFDPTSGVFTNGPAMSVARAGHSATLFANGRVFIAGGSSDGSAEILDLSAGISAAAGSLNVARSMHSAALLQDGRVLVVGGRDAAGNELSSGEIFDTPASNFWTIDNELKVTRVRAHLRVLFDGKVQIIGGSNDGSMEVYDPVFEGFGAYAHVLPESDPCVGLASHILASQTRAALFHMGHSDSLFDRSGHTITEVNGQALVLGGMNGSGAFLSSSSVVTSSSASISTDKMDYAPGEISHISGRGYQPGETVRVKIHEDPHTPQERGFDAVADAEGNFSGDYLVMDYDLNMKFIVGARGLTSGVTAQTTFTDARNLILTFAGTGTGTVTITPNTGTVNAPVSCGGTGTAQASQTVSTTCLPNITTSDNGATVTFNAVANGGSTFGGWSGQNALSSSSCNGTTNPCSAVLGGGPTLTVTFNSGVNTTTTVANQIATYGDSSVTLSATVTPTTGPAINSGSVTFTVKQGLTTIGVATTDHSIVAGAASVNYALPAGTNAGGYTIEASYTPGAGFNASSGTGALTINTRAIEVTADAGQFKTYGDSDPAAFAYTITSGSLVAPDAFTGALSRVAGEDAGLYAVTIGTLAINDGNGGNNYDLSFVSNDFEIKKKPATWTTNPNSKTYGDPDPVPLTSGSGSGFLVADGVTATYTRVAGENASPPTYHITATLSATPMSKLDNYIVTNDGAEFTIDKRAIEVTADAGQFKTYGDSDPAAFTYTITSGSLVAPDAFTGALSRVAGEDAGLYAVTIGTLAINDGNGGNNYDLSFVSNDFEIKKKPATWTTNPNSKTYGDPDPVPLTSGSGSGFLVADGVTATYARVAGENASPPTYHITATLSASPMSKLDNYIITNNGAEFTIDKRAIEVTADAGQFKTYGDPDPAAFTYTITNGTLAFSDAFTGALSRVAGENVGLYAITIGSLTISDGNGGNNYNLSLVSNSFEIKKRAITVKADPKTKTFADPDPAFTYQITVGSLAFSDSFTGALTRDPGELVGVYAIKIGTLAINDGNGGANYTLTFIGDNLTILTACSVFNGFLPPIGGAVEQGTGGSFGDPVRAFKLNSTIPVKFNAICFGTPLLTGIHTLQAIKYSNATDVEAAIDATPTDAATTGNQFRLTGTEWHFNLSTKALVGNAQGIWLLKATLFDGSTYSVWVSIKK